MCFLHIRYCAILYCTLLTYEIVHQFSTEHFTTDAF